MPKPVVGICLSIEAEGALLWPWIRKLSSRLRSLPNGAYGTHSLRRTKASIIYRATGNLRAVQILLGHSKIENTVRYLGIDVEDALALAENTEI